MKRLTLIFLGAALLCAGTLQAREWEIIRLEYTSSGDVYSTISVFSNNVNPYSMSTTDTYRLEIDRQDISLPFSFIRQLNMVHRVHVTHDRNTGEIVHTRRPDSCPGFFPKSGMELSVRYMKFRDGLDVLDHDDHVMKVVYTEGNCQYETSRVIHPQNNKSKIEAAKLAAILDTIKTMFQIDGI